MSHLSHRKVKLRLKAGLFGDPVLTLFFEKRYKNIGTFLFNGPKTYQKCHFFWHGPTVLLNGMATTPLIQTASDRFRAFTLRGKRMGMPKINKFHTATRLGTIHSSDYSRWDVPEKRHFLDH